MSFFCATLSNFGVGLGMFGGSSSMFGESPDVFVGVQNLEVYRLPYIPAGREIMPAHYPHCPLTSGYPLTGNMPPASQSRTTLGGGGGIVRARCTAPAIA